nr:MAG TPA: hypothetical protein [Caudoviricetes sp.]
MRGWILWIRFCCFFDILNIKLLLHQKRLSSMKW